MLERIEDHLRVDEPLRYDLQLVVRGWPLSIEGLKRNAKSTSERYILDGSPLVAVSAELTMAGWSLDQILAGRRLRTRSSYAKVTTRRVTDAGFVLLPTFDAPHYSIVWASYTDEQADRLLALFGPAITNPHYKGRQR